MGNTPLRYAEGKRHQAIVKILLDHGAVSSHATESAPIENHQASTDAMEKDTLTVQSASNVCSSQQDMFDCSANFIAASYDAISGTKTEDVRTIPSAGPLLHKAAQTGNIDLVTCLLRSGADINQPWGSYKNTPLHWAVKFHHPEMVELLLDHGAHIDAQNIMDETPLIIAATNGNEDSVQILLNNGAHTSYRIHLAEQTQLLIYMAIVKFLR